MDDPVRTGMDGVQRPLSRRGAARQRRLLRRDAAMQHLGCAALSNCAVPPNNDRCAPAALCAAALCVLCVAWPNCLINRSRAAPISGTNEKTIRS
jgi:hypothetical protein